MVYIIHFDSPLSHAQHYVGYTEDIQTRMDAHNAGTGARILEVCKERGITYRLVCILEGDRTEERRIKRGTHIGQRYCPICNPKIAPMGELMHELFNTITPNNHEKEPSITGISIECRED